MMHLPRRALRHADDGTAQELRAFHSKSEANAVEALAGARQRGESKSYLNMANASIQGTDGARKLCGVLERRRVTPGAL
mgnify:CR=1 FL=1